MSRVPGQARETTPCGTAASRVVGGHAGRSPSRGEVTAQRRLDHNLVRSITCVVPMIDHSRSSLDYDVVDELSIINQDYTNVSYFYCFASTKIFNHKSLT